MHTTHNAFGVGLRVGIEDGQSYLKTEVSPRERERGKAQKGDKKGIVDV
jgi:hypothetical protein